MLSWTRDPCGITFLPSRCPRLVGPEKPTDVALVAEVSANDLVWSFAHLPVGIADIHSSIKEVSVFGSLWLQLGY